MPTWWHTLQLDLLVSWPETFTTLWLVLSLMERQPNRKFCKIALMTVATSIYTDLFVYVLPLQWHTANSLFATGASLFLLFKELSLRHKLIAFCTFYLFVFLTDLLTLGLFMLGSGSHSQRDLIDGPILNTMVCLYPVLLIEWLIYGLIRRRRPGMRLKRLFANVVRSTRRDIMPVAALMFLQFGIMALVLILHLDNRDGAYSLTIMVMVYAAIAASLATLLLTVRLIARTREETARMTQDVYIEEINRMFLSIRGQRHDFVNNVQVMFTMLQMGKLQDLNMFMTELVKETHEVRDIVHHASPALAAFIQAKTAYAVSRGIQFGYELSETWTRQTTVRMIDIIRIVGNLVNNAFDAVEPLPPEERKVRVAIHSHSDRTEMTVTNSGPKLNERDRKRMFIPGFTTKQDDHSGLGLSIVREKVEHYKGTIDVSSDVPDETTFRVTLPHKTAAAAEHAG